MAEKKEKQYVSDNAKLMAEWDWEKNAEFNPEQITIGSGKKVWWICSKGHEWEATIHNRNYGTGCPYCSSNKVLKGYSDLQTRNPTLAKEWNYEKNNGLTPIDVLPNSEKKVWWRCSKGHEWQATISSRNYGCECPYCYGRYAIKGVNDLQTANPTLAKEWNYERNKNLTPMDVKSNSNKKVWWRCSRGHEWQAMINSRTNGHGCPYCSSNKVLKGYNDLQTRNPTLAKEWNYERNKNLTPMDVTVNSEKKVWWKCNKGHEWQAAINNRNSGNGCPHCSGQIVLKGYNDLQTVNPILASEWHYEKNGNLKPECFVANSHKTVWWKCEKGHEWQASIKSRNNRSGCPVCSSERKTSFPEFVFVFYLKKYGLEVIHSYKEKGYELDVFIPSKNVAIEYDGYFWHKTRTKHDLNKNSKCQKDGIKLYRIREGLPLLNDSSLDYAVQQTQKDLFEVIEKVLCEIIGTSVDVDLERDYIAIQNLREFTEKENSFLVSNPKVASEWNCEKNGNLKPEYFTTNSQKKVWWKCEIGHEWQATMANRSKGRGCPYCAGQKVLKGYNDLQTINPTLAKEWHQEKNFGFTPMDVTPNSNKKVWWKCSNGHEWQATISNRNRGSKCPQCYREKRKTNK